MTALATPRLALAPFAAADAEALLALFRDPDVRRYLLDDELVEPAWVEGEIAASAERFAGGGLGLWLARRDADAIGFVGFRPFFAPPVEQLLYGLLPACTGQGFAVEMADAVVAVAFAAWRETVRASVDAPNAASVRVLERLGFVEVGRAPGPHGETRHFTVHRGGWRRYDGGHGGLRLPQR